MKKALLLIAAGSILGACAQVDTGGKDHEYVEKTYRTGSNIPANSKQKSQDGVATASGEEVDNMRNSSLSTPKGFSPPGGGH